MCGLVIGRSDDTVVQTGVWRKRCGQVLVRIPTIELVARSRTERRGNLSADIDAEVHFLVIGAPVKRGVGTRIGMQEHTVLDLYPLGINGNAAIWHGLKFVRMSTVGIDVPAREDESGGVERRIINVIRCGNEVVVPTFVVAAHIGTIRDACHLIQLADGFLAFNTGTGTTVDVDAVQEGNRLEVSRVVVVDFPVVSDPYPIYLGHARVCRGMLLGFPVATRVMGKCENVFVELILSRLVHKVNVIPPLILAAGGVVIRVQVVTIFASQISQDLFVHDGDFALDCSLAIGLIRL